MVNLKNFKKGYIQGIYYERYGRRKPYFVFIHSPGTNCTVWHHLMHYLADRYQSVIALDLRNHGKSKGGSITYQNLVEDIRKILNSIGVPYILVFSCISSVFMKSLLHDPLCVKAVSLMPTSGSYLTFKMRLYRILGKFLLKCRVL